LPVVVVVLPVVVVVLPVVVVVLPVVVVVLPVVVVVLGGVVFLVPPPGATDFFGPVVVVAFGATVPVVDVAVEVCALLCFCALNASAWTFEGDPPTDAATAIPPPTTASARTAMPARVAVLLRGLITGLVSVMVRKVTGHIE
jgi:hypothetical protein